VCEFHGEVFDFIESKTLFHISIGINRDSFASFKRSEKAFIVERSEEIEDQDIRFLDGFTMMTKDGFHVTRIDL